MINYLFLVSLTVFGALGGYFLKLASEKSKNILRLFFTIYFYIGGLLYFVSAVLNIYVLKSLDYTIVLPITSLTYIWSSFLSFIILKEKFSIYKIIGLILILIGAFLIAISD